MNAQKPKPDRPRLALSEAREIVRQICRCGHTQGEHGALYPDAPPGEKYVGGGICWEGRELVDDPTHPLGAAWKPDEPICGCRRFRRAKLRVEAR